MLKQVCDKGQIVEVALNTHGTRAVQKLIETLTSREQRALVISALTPGVVSLIKDLNGNHVVQRCLQRLGPDDSQFVYDAARKHCMEIATHRHGCCVLQRCIDFATPTQKNDLVQEVARHALQLSQVRGEQRHEVFSYFPREQGLLCTPRAAGQFTRQRPPVQLQAACGMHGLFVCGWWTCLRATCAVHAPGLATRSRSVCAYALLGGSADASAAAVAAALRWLCCCCCCRDSYRTRLATMWCSTFWSSARRTAAGL